MPVKVRLLTPLESRHKHMAVMPLLSAVAFLVPVSISPGCPGKGPHVPRIVSSEKNPFAGCKLEGGG